MVNASSSQKNIWVAASDGDLERVKELLGEGFSPNEKDHNSYTPMHAAASYAHLELLNYLLSVGGNINLPDDDGETPLFTVETMEAARFLIETGADVNWENDEGQTAADGLEDDHPDIAAYLRSLSAQPNAPLDQPPTGAVTGDSGPNNVAIEQLADLHSSRLMEEAQAILEQAERDGVEPDEQLRAIIERHVNEAQAARGVVGQDQGSVEGQGDTTKRPRADGDAD